MIRLASYDKTCILRQDLHPTYKSNGPTYKSTGPTYKSTGPTYKSTGPTYSSNGPTYKTRYNRKCYYKNAKLLNEFILGELFPISP